MKASSGPEGDVAHEAHDTASEQRPEGRGGDGRQASRFEVVATVILALAAVATAWGGYQASRWHGEQAIAFSHANASRVESTRASNLANTQTEIDVATFSQWVDAYARHETRLADFYRRRFRREFQPAVAAWIATRPLENADAPLTPFAMPVYRLEAAARAERLTVAASAAAAEASRDIRRANDYVLRWCCSRPRCSSAASVPVCTAGRAPWSSASGVPCCSARSHGWRPSLSASRSGPAQGGSP